MVPEIWSATDTFFVILGHCLPFYPSHNPKKQNFEKLKKTPGVISILHKCTKNHNHMLYFPKTWRVTDVIFIFHFCPFAPLMAQKIKILKDEKNAWRYDHFTHAYQKLWSHAVRFLRYGVRLTDGQTDGQMDEKSGM